MSRLGMIRVAAGTPVVTVANPLANEPEILKLMAEAEEQKAGILLLPELVITGATAGDLFHQELLYRKQLEVLERIVLSSAGMKLTTVLGFYFRLENNYYNCAALIKDGKIFGIVPKMNMPCAYDSANARFFASGKEIAESYDEVKIFGEYVPFGNIVFCDDESGLSLGIEVGEDFMSPLSPGTHLALNGAHIILNPAATAETAGSCELRKSLIKAMSEKAVCGYVHAGAGAGESTTDLVFGGHHVIAEAGDVIAENDAVLLHGKLTVIEIDYDRIKYDRSLGHVFAETAAYYSDRLMYQTVDVSGLRVCDTADRLIRNFAKNPFVPSCPELAKNRLGEIFAIQAAAYAKRMKHTHSNKSVIGISGGLDSTLALLVTAQVHRLLGIPAENIVAVTMPGFGTTDTTYNNALTIMKTLGCDVREISIVPSVRQHFADIGHDETIRDLTYENAQARERTQILMDIAGKEGGLVVGTGDLSELVLGWCTYNGDHMAMYGVNAGIPKTTVQHVVKWVIENILSGECEVKDFSMDNAVLAKALQDILDTPISPELLPPEEDGSIAQKTEDKVGPYTLHDFFIYHTLRYGMEPAKLLCIAEKSFAGEFDRDFIKKWLAVFYRRFFTQQFKRSCMPDGPKVFDFSLSPRGDLMMPSDADFSMWLAEMETL